MVFEVVLHLVDVCIMHILEFYSVTVALAVISFKPSTFAGEDVNEAARAASHAIDINGSDF